MNQGLLFLAVAAAAADAGHDHQFLHSAAKSFERGSLVPLARESERASNSRLFPPFPFRLQQQQEIRRKDHQQQWQQQWQQRGSASATCVTRVLSFQSLIVWFHSTLKLYEYLPMHELHLLRFPSLPNW